MSINEMSTVTESASLSDLFPPIEPYCKQHFRVSELHQIYVEECGNPKGQAVLFLHGGPGAGISTTHRRLFDPKHFRIVLFDQRGAGKSLPHAELRDNTTWDLVADIEKLDSAWMVAGELHETRRPRSKDSAAHVQRHRNCVRTCGDFAS